MTDDQMPDEIYAVGSSVIVNGSGKTVLGMYSDTKPEKGTTKYIRADIATPPKSQGAEIAEAVKYFEETHPSLKDPLTKSQHIVMLRTLIQSATRQHPTPAQSQDEHVVRCNKCKGTCVYKTNGQNEIEVFHSCATPAQAQGESVTVEELMLLAHADTGRARTIDDCYCEIRKGVVKRIMAEYTIIKRTE